MYKKNSEHDFVMIFPKNVELKPVERIEYTGGDADIFSLRDFVTDLNEDSVLFRQDCAEKKCSASSPISHDQYELEQYNLEDLVMVGTISDDNDLIALIKTPDGLVLQAKVGSYIGKNNGLVENISATNIIVKEKVKLMDGWLDKESILDLRVAQ